ncbi:MAG: DUF2723 domain-containing protein [Chloroflexota bacterium]
MAAGVSAIAALTLYVRTLAPTVGTGDSGELSTVAATLGLAHPPGYPTFTVLGHLFTWLPVGDPAYRVNLMSAVLDALAVGVAVLIAGRLIEAAHVEAARGGPDAGPRRAWLPWAAAAVGGLALAFSTAFWRYSLVAEVFALANLLALLVLLLMIEWSRRPERSRFLWAAGLVAGLALTNQQTIAFAAPAFVVLLGLGLTRYTAPPPGRRKGRPVPWRAVGIGVGLGLVGMLPYLYLPIAGAAGADTVWGDPTSIGGFLGIVGRSAYGTLSLTVRDTSGSALEHIGLFVGYLVSAYSPVGIGLAFVGGAWLAVRRTGEAAALGLWLVMTGPVFLALANPPLTDPVTRGVLERFYLLPSLPVALVVAAGAWFGATWLGDHIPAPAVVRAWTRPAAVAVAIAALGGLALVRLPEVDESGNRVAEIYADDLLGALPPNTVLLMRSDENYTSVTYAQEVRGLRPDVVAIDVELLKIDAYVDLIEARHPGIQVPFRRYDGGSTTSLGEIIDLIGDTRPVYVAGKLEEDLDQRYDLLDAGLVDEVRPDGLAPDSLARLRADPGIFDRLQPPTRTWPETTWEAAIAANYADVAFEIGVALQQLGPQPDADVVERYYRAAIRISPTLASAYKNLGLLLQVNGAPAAEIVAAWERYLELKPDDPEAGAIRAAIDRLEAGQSPGPISTPAP